ncbi:hypothetical protein QWV09_00570 [Neisseria gonorrhoeae]
MPSEGLSDGIISNRQAVGRDWVGRNAHPASETLLRHSHAGRNLDI